MTWKYKNFPFFSPFSPPSFLFLASSCHADENQTPQIIGGQSGGSHKKEKKKKTEFVRFLSNTYVNGIRVRMSHNDKTSDIKY